MSEAINTLQTRLNNAQNRIEQISNSIEDYKKQLEALELELEQEQQVSADIYEALEKLTSTQQTN